MYSTSELTEIYNRNIDMVYRICFMQTKNKFDAEDMSQNVFLRLIKHGKHFDSHEHEKAWLIRAAVNQCKDLFKSSWKKKTVFINDNLNTFTDKYGSPLADETLEKVLALKPKYKEVIYLYYYEGYSTPEISRLLNKPESTVRSRLSRGRKLLEIDINIELSEENICIPKGVDRDEIEARI